MYISIPCFSCFSFLFFLSSIYFLGWGSCLGTCSKDVKNSAL